MLCYDLLYYCEKISDITLSFCLFGFGFEATPRSVLRDQS